MTYTQRFEKIRRERERQIRRRVLLGISACLLVFSLFVHLQTQSARQEYQQLQDELKVQEKRLEALRHKQENRKREQAAEFSPYLLVDDE